MGHRVLGKTKRVVVHGLAAILLLSIGYFSANLQNISEQNQITTCMMHRSKLQRATFPDNATERPLISSTSTTTRLDEPLWNFDKYPCHPHIPKAPKNACVRIFNDTTTDVLPTIPCASLTTMNGSTTPVCTYDPKVDIFVSKTLRIKGVWEAHLIYKLEAILRDHPDMQFLDIGCNKGAYTLTMAHLGRTVVAVDALIDNLQLLNKSLALGNLQKHVTLIWNVLSDTHTTMTFVVPHENVAATQKVGKNYHPGPHFQVQSIMLNDLIPVLKDKRVVIKIDVEAHEYNVLNGGAQFFDTVDVSLIQMEWKFHYYDKTGIDIVNFLSYRGFKPFRDIDGKQSLEGSKISNWPEDIYFVKQSSGQKSYI